MAKIEARPEGASATREENVVCDVEVGREFLTSCVPYVHTK